MGIKNCPNVVESFSFNILYHVFPKGPTQLYDSNLFFRAQHFFCVSMRDEFKGQDNLEISTIYPHFVKDTNFFKLLWKYATVIKIKDIMPPNIASVPQFQPVFNALTNNLKDPLFTEDLASFSIKSTNYNNTPISIHVMAVTELRCRYLWWRYIAVIYTSRRLFGRFCWTPIRRSWR